MLINDKSFILFLFVNCKIVELTFTPNALIFNYFLKPENRCIGLKKRHG